VWHSWVRAFRRYRPADSHEQNSVVPLLGMGVDWILPDDPQMFPNDGRTLGYDSMLIAMGGEPFVANASAYDVHGVISFST